MNIYSNFFWYYIIFLLLILTYLRTYLLLILLDYNQFLEHFVQFFRNIFLMEIYPNVTKDKVLFHKDYYGGGGEISKPPINKAVSVI